MLAGNFRHLPVVEGERVVGVVSIRDLSRATLRE
jgi:CBS domain-containing protein